MIVPTTTGVLAVSWGFQGVAATLVDAALDEYVERVQSAGARCV